METIARRNDGLKSLVALRISISQRWRPALRVPGTRDRAGLLPELRSPRPAWTTCETRMGGIAVWAGQVRECEA